MVVDERGTRDVIASCNTNALRFVKPSGILELSTAGRRGGKSGMERLSAQRGRRCSFFVQERQQQCQVNHPADNPMHETFGCSG